MSLDDTIAGMKEEAHEMGRWYYKGFGNVFNGILGIAQLYLCRPDRVDLVDTSYEWLKEIEDHYGGIPFAELHGRERFYPLFVVDGLLPKFRNRMDEFFSEKDEAALEGVETYAKTFV